MIVNTAVFSFEFFLFLHEPILLGILRPDRPDAIGSRAER